MPSSYQLIGSDINSYHTVECWQWQKQNNNKKTFSGNCRKCWRKLHKFDGKMANKNDVHVISLSWTATCSTRTEHSVTGTQY